MRIQTVLLVLGLLIGDQANAQPHEGENGNESKCGWRLHSLAFFMELYRNDHGRYPERLDQLNSYPAELPPFHCAGSETPYSYRGAAKGSGYLLRCVSGKHRHQGYPRYSKQGLQWTPVVRW
ncbi:hypothetical protein IV102_15480 [bacterium]|nr:hypothetical protein [bacterium]